MFFGCFSMKREFFLHSLKSNVPSARGKSIVSGASWSAPTDRWEGSSIIARKDYNILFHVFLQDWKNVRRRSRNMQCIRPQCLIPKASIGCVYQWQIEVAFAPILQDRWFPVNIALVAWLGRQTIRQSILFSEIEIAIQLARILPNDQNFRCYPPKTDSPVSLWQDGLEDRASRPWFDTAYLCARKNSRS